MSISKAEIQFFQQKGYLLVDQSSCEAAIEESRTLFIQNVEKIDTHGQRIQGAWKSQFAITELTISKKLLGILSSLFHAKAFAFKTLNFRMRAQQRVHSDTIHFNSLPRRYMAGILIAVEDVDSSNGGIIYYPKSHLLTEITMQDVGVELGYENYIEVLINKLELKHHYAKLKKGPALIWHANLLLGKTSHLDKTRTRSSQITDYFSQNYRYYTPPNSKQNGITWDGKLAKNRSLDEANTLLKKIIKKLPKTPK